MRIRAILGLVLVAVLIGLSGSSLAAKPHATPRPKRHARTLEDTVLALTHLKAYRFRVETVAPLMGPPRVTTGTVIGDPIWRTAIDTYEGGEIASRRVASADGAWWSEHGSAFRRCCQEVDPRHPRLPFDPLLSGMSLGWTPLGTGQKGPKEERDGRTVRKLTFTWPVRGHAGGDGFEGTAEVWLDVADGYLVESHVVGGFPGAGIAADGAQAPITVEERVVITDIDDPGLTIELPDLSPVQPGAIPVGDPGVADLVLGATDALADLTSYRATRPPLVPGLFSAQRVTVVNRPTRIVQVEVTLSTDTITRLLATDDTWWTSFSPDLESWYREDGAFFWDTCGDIPPCSFDRVADLAEDLSAIASSFRKVGEGEVINGTPTIHLRSDAGWTDPNGGGRGWVPGTWDVWIAAGDGHLVRETFDGQAIVRTLDIFAVDDPANVLTVPEGRR